MGRWKIKDHLATWDKKDLRVATEAGKMATKVTIDVTSTGDHHELEATTAFDRGFSDQFLSQLGRA